MKVKALKNFTLGGHVVKAGTELELPDAEAKQLIGSGLAEAATPENKNKGSK